MRALSLPQPWATLVATGQIRWLMRPWRTMHRGLLAIHARKQPHPEMRSARWRPLGRLPLGALVGVVEVVGCRPVDLLPAKILEGGLFPAEPGWWAWELSEARPMAPVACAGGRGLFEVKPFSTIKTEEPRTQ